MHARTRVAEYDRVKLAAGRNSPEIAQVGGAESGPSEHPLGQQATSGPAGVDAGQPTCVEPCDCEEGETEPCGETTDIGTCRRGSRFCEQGVWGECVGAFEPGIRDCRSELDNDCDGSPDNTIDEVCACVPGSSEPCAEHPGLDGVGPCQAGHRQCELSEDGSSSDWGECTGSVAPAEQDNCAVANDDSNCDGVANGPPCTCAPGETQRCGPSSDLGLCEFGVSTCQNNQFGACEGARLPELRNCASPLDHDCDGKADNSLDDVCTCEVGTTMICGQHPGLDELGICKAGLSACVAEANGAASRQAECQGSVGPTIATCASSQDLDCDGERDDSRVGTSCVVNNAVGACRSGSYVCAEGELRCEAPAARDEICDEVDNDCDGQIDETCINVLSSRIGCLDIQITGNLTDVVALACDQRTTCSYKAPTPQEYEALGVTAFTRSFCTQAMEVVYECGPQGRFRTIEVRGDAWNEPPAFLSCSE